jgi:hypothetical protein
MGIGIGREHAGKKIGRIEKKILEIRPKPRIGKIVMQRKSRYEGAQYTGR